MQRSGFDSTISIAASSSGLYATTPPRLDAAGRGDDDLRLRVLDPARELVGREAAEDDRVNRADPGAREHRDHRLGHHRHVDDDAVARLDALGSEHARETRDGIAQLAVGEGRRSSR